MHFKKFNFERLGNRLPRWKVLPEQVWRCKDGYVKWGIRVAGRALNTRVMVNWMGREGEAGELKDVKWEEIAYQTMNPEDFYRWESMFAKFLEKHTVAEFEEEVVAKNPSYSHFPLNTPKEVLESPQLAARNYWFKIGYPELGTTIVHPGAPYKSSEIAWRTPRRAPMLGEHNEEIYQGELGFSKGKMCLLKQGNII